MFETIKTKKNYEKIIDQLQDMILKGELKKGDKLPSEKLLTEEFQVSRSSLREALKVLEFMGLIESKHGEGSYIVNNVELTILKSIALAFKLNNGTIKDIMELRYTLELYSVKKIALNKDISKIQKLESIVNEMEKTRDIIKSEELDIKLHNEIIKSSDNILFDIVADSIFDLLSPYIRSMRSLYTEIYNNPKYSNDEDSQSRFVSEHKKLIETFKTFNLSEITKEVTSHIIIPDENLELLYEKTSYHKKI